MSNKRMATKLKHTATYCSNESWKYVANFKMQFSYNEMQKYMQDHYEALIALSNHSLHPDLIVCPSFESIDYVASFLKTTSIKVGAQDCAPALEGAYTGQVSARSLAQLGCTHAIVGHKETRMGYQITHKEIIQKVVCLIDQGLIPIVCIGEIEKESSQKEKMLMLKEQLTPLIAPLIECNSSRAFPLYIAYEPQWAIGTRTMADAQHISFILNLMEELCAPLRHHYQLSYLYGGSVDRMSTAFLKNIPLLNGLLIGRASLDFKNFESIVLSTL